MGVWEDLGNPEQAARLLLHPAHPAVAATVAELIAEQREVSGRSESRVVQEKLVGAISEAERRFGKARQAEKRGVGDPLDVAFWRRAVVQLRAVGDAVAWKFLAFRRQWLLLMGRNQHPGHVTTKAGFAVEWQLFQEHWEEGEPTVLTGLTNCITLGDLLVAHDDELWTIEVKRNASHHRPSQMRKLALLREQLMGMPRIDGREGPSWVQECDVPYRTFWSSADSHIERAMTNGFATWVPVPGVGVLFGSVAGSAALGRMKAQEVLASEQAAAAAALGGTTHKIVLHSYHYPYRSARSAPYGVYPIRSKYAAMLLSEELNVSVEIHVDRLLRELRRVGFRAEHLLPEGSDNREQPVPRDIIRWYRGVDRGTVHASAIEQLGLELLDPTAWADALAASFSPPGPERKWGAYVCLADEDKVWR